MCGNHAPFERGAREIADWYLADPARQVTDASLDAVMDKLAAAWSQRNCRWS